MKKKFRTKFIEQEFDIFTLTRETFSEILDLLYENDYVINYEYTSLKRCYIEVSGALDQYECQWFINQDDIVFLDEYKRLHVMSQVEFDSRYEEIKS